MKLIIDIPEDRYKDVIESQKHHLLDSYAQAVANGIPLNKIRAEIKALPRELPTDARNMVRRTRVLDIIDRHIKGADK